MKGEEIQTEYIGDTFPRCLEIYTALKENQLAHCYEPAPGLFIAESPQIIRMAIDAGYEPESFLFEEGAGEKFLKELPAQNEDRDGFTYDASQKGAPVFSALKKKVISECFASEKKGTSACSVPEKKETSACFFPEMKEGSACTIPEKKKITAYIASHEAIKKLAGYELTGGALAAFRRKKLPTAEEILKGARRVAVLECVMNPRNVGSVFRSAAAIGFDAVLLTKGACDPLYRRAARVSMGTVFQIPWTFAGDLSVLKKEGFTTVAMALTDDSVSMADPVLKGHEKLAVLMGSERSGLRAETIREADYTAKIPMKHDVDSLNVAAASAVAFWELRNT